MPETNEGSQFDDPSDVTKSRLSSQEFQMQSVNKEIKKGMATAYKKAVHNTKYAPKSKPSPPRRVDTQSVCCDCQCHKRNDTGASALSESENEPSQARKNLKISAN